MKKEIYKILVVMFLHGSTDVRGSQHCENIRLQCRHQQLNQVDERRENRYSRAYCQALEDENHTQKAQKNNVTRSDVGKQSNHE